MSGTAGSGSAFSFVRMEREILDFWAEREVFQKSLERTRDSKPYIFYDGPPFATGLPHHGNLLASVIKDIVPRYWTMRGRHVLRRFGWDCHGLPVEHEIDKQLGMSAAEAVAKLGVAGYNAECRGIVERYVDEWRGVITRIGRWVDFDDDYKTMDAWYMESVWWVVKQLWDKGLIYQGFKVMPVSTALETPLANFEANMNYRDVQDPAITVTFELADEDAHLTAWTTTPWTLPSNLAVCVGADIDYVKARDRATGKTLYLAKERLDAYAARHDLEPLAELKGADLVGRAYKPLFPYFQDEARRGAFVVVADDYVTTSEGTGLVHQAPAFGEDDFRVLREHGIEAFVCPVGMDGVFTDAVQDFAGQFVKDADANIIAWLKRAGALYEQAVVEHAYPHCWRSDTPLIYRPVPSWFVRVTDLIDDLLAANEKVRWVPEHIQHGRFGNWLAAARDWAISRNRVWGTPLPIWRNDETGREVCVGSIDELAARTGVKPTDLHREFVDPLTFEVEGEAGVYRRVEEVLDCWFESGAMPYAQLHYPFENERVFERGFPAEFIAEGLDQTRGWFYTLMVLSAALYKRPAFKNVIVNGLVMAEDGKKMSKSLKNYTPPDELMETYGADSLRLYLINSGLVRAEDQHFRDAGVKDMARRALLPWYNAFAFLRTYASIDGWAPALGFHHGSNVLDRWLLSRLQTLKAGVAEEMAAYRLYNVVPRLFEFIEDLTNWYIRLNRQRFWGEQVDADKIAAYSALHTAVYELTLSMAPFAPFLAEHIYLELKRLSGDAPNPISVHLCDYPDALPHLHQPALEAAVERMRRVVLLGRRKREDARVNLRTPLSRLVIIHHDQAVLDEIAELERYVKAELNVKAVAYDTDESRYIDVQARPDFPVLGKRLGKRMKAFQASIGALAPDAIRRFQAVGELTLDGETFGPRDIQVVRAPRPGTGVLCDATLSIDLDCELNDALVREGLAREAVNRLQRSRRDLGFEVTDRIRVAYGGDADIVAALEAHADYVAGEVLAVQFAAATPLPPDALRSDIHGRPFAYQIERA